MPSQPERADKGVFLGCTPAAFVRSSGLILLPQYLMNGSSSVGEIAHTDDLIRYWMSEVKVTAGRPGGDGIHFDATLERRSRSSVLQQGSRIRIKVRRLVYPMFYEVYMNFCCLLARLFDRVDLIKPVSNALPSAKMFLRFP